MAGKIIGLGGVFIRSKDSKSLMKWYQDVLDIKMNSWGTTFSIQEIKDKEMQVFSVFNQDSDYIHKHQSYMINWMVDDLDILLEKLKIKNIVILGMESSEFGKFAWINDLDGNKLEFWEPPHSAN